jgi:hypothetical protein
MKKVFGMLFTMIYHAFHAMDQLCVAADELSTYVAEEAHGTRLEGQADRTKRIELLRAEAAQAQAQPAPQDKEQDKDKDKD